MHTKQHPCKESGDPDCGYCFPIPKIEPPPVLKSLMKLSQLQAEKIAQAVYDIAERLAANDERMAKEYQRELIGYLMDV